MDIDIGHTATAIQHKPLPFGQKGSIFGNHRGSRVAQIGTTLSRPAAGVDIRSHTSGTLTLDQLLAVGVLAHQLITGREIEKQLGSRCGLKKRWRHHTPQILTYLDPKAHLTSLEEQIHTKRSTQQSGIFYLFTATKPPFLVKFPVIGQVSFWHDPSDLTIVQDHGAVVEPILVPQRCPDDYDAFHYTTSQLLKSLYHFLSDIFLKKEILEAVAGETKLWKKDKGAAFVLVDQGAQMLHIGLYVPKKELGRESADAIEAKHHSLFSLISIFSITSS